MNKQFTKLLGVGAVSLAAMGAGAPAMAGDFTCSPDTGLTACYRGFVSGSSSAFSNFEIGSLNLDIVSDVIGLLATTNMDLSSMTLTSGSSSVVADMTTEGFAFDDVASGNYRVSISGMLTGMPVFGTQFSPYSGGVLVVPIPEPETYALMLAGLATLGALARRRSRR
jgi:hypothetical protein